MIHLVVLLFLLPALAPGGGLPAGAPAPARPQPAQAPASQLYRLESSVDSMGSTYSVALYGKNQDQLEIAVEAAFDEVRRLDHMLSNYRPESELSEVNRYAAERPVKVTPELFQLLSDCVEYSRKSQGTFDISVGPLMKVWGFFKGTGHMPQKEAVARALKKVGYGNILLDPANRTVRFAQRGVELDPGGIGKGYTVDRVLAVLKENGIASALISAGGSSIYALGSPGTEDKGWEVKIRDPRDERRTVQQIFLKNQSMSTSGSYEKFFVADGKVYSHIMDPRTGFPAAGVSSVSVIAPRTLDSEAWTKPFFILGRKWTAEHKPKDLRVFLCEDKAETACAWLQ